VTFRASLVAGALLSSVAIAGGTSAARQPAALRLGTVRALVISPHPDDAALSAGGLIQRVIHEGGALRVVQMTGGDAFPKGVTAIRPGTRPTPGSFRSYGSLREHEAIRAMRLLGIHRSQIRLLGFPDEGLCVLASADRTGTAYASPYTRRDSPPDSEQIVRGTMYRGDDLARELTHLMEAFRPTLVVLPYPGDEHPDHCATHLLAHRALADAVRAGLGPPRILHYVIHYREWPTAEKADAPLEPPSGMQTGERWRTLTLTPAERTAKGRALDAYRSQMLVMRDFMRAFERPNELFIESEPSRPIPCWCEGGTDIAAPASGVQ
jgi:LmbE family N-acetylglucosaminyl deacetylase